MFDTSYICDENCSRVTRNYTSIITFIIEPAHKLSLSTSISVQYRCKLLQRINFVKRGGKVSRLTTSWCRWWGHLQIGVASVAGKQVFDEGRLAHPCTIPFCNNRSTPLWIEVDPSTTFIRVFTVAFLISDTLIAWERYRFNSAMSRKHICKMPAMLQLQHQQ